VTKPTPKPVDPAELPALALGVIRADRFPLLATVDGDQPRVRPVSPVKTDGFTVYVANLRGFHKTGELAANPRVELCYLDQDHNQVRLTGTAEVVAERALLEVRQSNWAAQRLYRSLGFHGVALRRGYYTHPSEDALILEKRDLGAGPERVRG